MSPGKKDYKTIKSIRYQKRMLLYNIKEIYLIILEQYKKNNVEKQVYLNFLN